MNSLLHDHGLVYGPGNLRPSPIRVNYSRTGFEVTAGRISVRNVSTHNGRSRRFQCVLSSDIPSSGCRQRVLLPSKKAASAAILDLVVLCQAPL